MKIRAWGLVAVVMLGVGGYFGLPRFNAQQAIKRARAAVRVRDWRTARKELQTYLNVYSTDESARLELAESYFKDDALNPDRAVSSAIKQLQFIRRESPLFPAARVQEARMWLFAGMQPHHAESLLLEALAADPESVEAHYMLWKVEDLTGRSHLAEPHFQAVLKKTSEEQRLLRLREWYMSQFYPATANLEIDLRMGFFEPGGKQNAITELRRLEAFRARESQSALNHATVAKWYSLEGNPKHALELLQAALDVANTPLQEPYFVATLTQVLFDLGEFDNALKYFRAWPGERSGYDYSRLEAILADEVERDFERAIRGYRQVIAVWPGPADWRMQFRLARCLAKAGDENAAEVMRQRAKQIELLMEEGVHSPLRKMLANPAQLEICERMSQFYEQLGLVYETQQWREQFHRIQQKSDRTARTRTP